VALEKKFSSKKLFLVKEKKKFARKNFFIEEIFFCWMQKKMFGDFKSFQWCPLPKKISTPK